VWCVCGVCGVCVCVVCVVCVCVWCGVCVCVCVCGVEQSLDFNKKSKYSL